MQSSPNAQNQNGDSKSAQRTQIIIAIIGLIGVLGAAWIGNRAGVSTGVEQAQATAVGEQATAVAAAPAITAVTQVVANPDTVVQTVVVTAEPIIQTIVVTSEPIVQTVLVEVTSPSVPEAVPADAPLEAGAAFTDAFDTSLKPEWEIISPGLAVTNGSLSGSGSVIYYPRYDDYRIRMKTMGLNFTVIARHNDTYKGYRFECVADSRDCQWWAGISISGRDTLSPKLLIPREIVTDATHDLIIEVKGRTLTALIDGVHIGTATDERYNTGGVGLKLYQGSIDEFSVEPLP